MFKPEGERSAGLRVARFLLRAAERSRLREESCNKKTEGSLREKHMADERRYLYDLYRALFPESLWTSAEEAAGKIKLEVAVLREHMTRQVQRLPGNRPPATGKMRTPQQLQYAHDLFSIALASESLHQMLFEGIDSEVCLHQLACYLEVLCFVLNHPHDTDTLQANLLRIEAVLLLHGIAIEPPRQPSTVGVQ